MLPSVNSYAKVGFVYGGVRYDNIHVFHAAKVAPYMSSQSAKALTDTFGPSGVSASKVICKTNGTMYSGAPTKFFGIQYFNQNLYFEGVNKTSTASSISTDSTMEIMDKDRWYWPSLCIKSDGTATIRWFTRAELQRDYRSYKAIIGAIHPLVYNNKDVLATEVTADDGIMIAAKADWSAEMPDPNHTRHYNWNAGQSTTPRERTLLGITPGGGAVLVCSRTGFTMRVASSLMYEMGCKWAVALDGGDSTGMVQYGTKVCSGPREQFGHIICRLSSY